MKLTEEEGRKVRDDSRARGREVGREHVAEMREKGLLHRLPEAIESSRILLEHGTCVDTPLYDFRVGLVETLRQG